MPTEFLNARRIRQGLMGSNDTYGFNGAFQFVVNYLTARGAVMTDEVFVIASDGEGWQHVSVSLAGRPHVCPRWELMVAVKDLFWAPEDAVMQVHPPARTYVNQHPGTLHLWRPLQGAIPLPDPRLVGTPGAAPPDSPEAAGRLFLEANRDRV